MISVIVPVYNVDKYLNACIDSILRQSFDDFELLLVDDGSSDSSPAICDEYASRDPRVKVFHKANGGVSDARNTGLDHARGEYVAFIDGDDWIQPDYLEMLHDRMQSGSFDLVTSGLVWWHSDNDQEVDSLDEVPLLDIDVESDMVSLLSQHHMTSPVSKLYRMDIIKEAGLRFDTRLSFGEDRDFNIRYLRFAKLVSTIGYAGYFYRRDLQDSLSVRKINHNYLVDIDYWDKLSILFSNREFSSESSRALLAHRLYYIISDSISDIVAKNSLSGSIRIIRNLFDGVTHFDFLKSNADLISAPALMKSMILGKKPVLISIYLKLVRS